MKKLLTSLVIFSASLTLFAQVEIDRYNWNNKVAFKNSGVPFEKTFGPLSDSLMNTTDDNTHFYFHNDVYYAVNSWADYFLWYTQKYNWKFIEGTHAYEYYHMTNNNEEMMRFVFENSQIGINHPFASSAKFTPLTNRRRISSPVLFEKMITSTPTPQVSSKSPRKLNKQSTSSKGLKVKE